MEISMIASSQVNLGRSFDAGLFNFGNNLSAKISNLKNTNSKMVQQSFKWPSKSVVGFTLRASATAQTADSVNFEKPPIISRTKLVDGIKLFVGLPLDTVSSSNKINRARAIAAGLKALKLSGVTGVELPVWWGIAEKEGMGKYDWTSYLAVVEMIRKLGLELHVSLCFHASKECRIGLPEWVSRIGQGNPDIYFKDRLGQQCEDCISFAVDDVPVLDGKTPVEVYRDFCDDFKANFSPLGSTITSVSIGLGPDGELRYPHHHQPGESNCGTGELQCYDQLLSHGDRILSLATSTFKDTGIAVSGRVPLIYNAAGLDAYDNIAGIFSRNACGIIIPGMDLTDSSPQSLLKEITSSCREHRVVVSGQNSLPSGIYGGFDQIKKRLLDVNSSVDTFTYQRMGASFFSPEHFNPFVQFVRCLNQPVRRLDDITVIEDRDDESVLGSCRMQTA